MIAILGGLGAATLWAAATLCSSRSSRMLGSRVVLAWVMIIGVIVAVPIAAVSPLPSAIDPIAFPILLLAGVCYCFGLQLAYAALRIGKVSIVAPIVATEGAVAALIAVALGEPLAIGAALMLAVIVFGVVLSSLEPSKPDVAAGSFDLTADAIDAPGDAPVIIDTPDETRKTAALAIAAAFVFGLGLVSAGHAAQLVPVAWVALSARLVGLVVVVAPIVLARRLTFTRAALPLLLIAGTGEVFGSMLSAWGSRDSIAVTAVMGSQFAAIAAVAAYFLFGERLGRLQVAGVICIVIGVTALAAFQA